MELVLHLGAHKTASTYLQRRLIANDHVLSAHGITFVAPMDYRPALSAASRVQVLNRKAWAQRWRRRRVLGRMYAAGAAKGHQRFVLSEENLIGNPNRLVLGTCFYDRVRQELKGLAGFIGRRPVRALLAIRNYADFFPSAYGEVLKLRGFVPFDHALRARYLSMNRGWPDLIADIAAALPEGSDLKLWQHEAMSAYEPLILGQFVGPEVAELLDPLEDRPQQGASARAVAHLHHVAGRGARIGRDRVRRVFLDNPKTRGHPPFDPWSAAERSHLDARYAADLARIASQWPTALIHPPIPGRV